MEAARNGGLGFICFVIFFLCLRVRAYVVATGTDTLSIRNRGKFVTGGKMFWLAYCIGGHFVLFFFLGGFLTGGLMVGCLGPGDFCRRLLTQSR